MRAERVKKLSENLERKLGIFTESATGPNDVQVTESFRTICQLEAECVPFLINSDMLVLTMRS